MLYYCASVQTNWNHVSTGYSLCSFSETSANVSLKKFYKDLVQFLFAEIPFLYLQLLYYLLHVSRCICGYLSSKPRILVTHQLQYLKEADQLLVLSDVSISY